MAMLLRLNEAADELAVSLTTVERYVSRGELEVTRLGRAVRVTPAQLQRFIARKADPGQHAPAGRRRTA